MFWNKKQVCPLEPEDIDWINEKLKWIDDNIVNVLDQTTILPTKRFFDFNFEGRKEDVRFLLNSICEYCKVENPERIDLEFYSEGEMKISQYQSIEKKGGTAGLYRQRRGRYQIFIEEKQLQNPESLIATLAHELSHYVLIGLNNVYLRGEENEWLTDLLAIAYGFGIFIGNSKFHFEQWSSGDGWGGWSSSSQGYLPQRITAYVMAEIEVNRLGGNPDWLNHLERGFRSEFVKCMKYLKQEREK